MTAKTIVCFLSGLVLGATIAISADAAELAPAAPQRCRIVYINGDAVITCPTLIVRGGK